MAVFMPAPATYTGDDVAEISAHGSQPVLAGILEACVAAGARLAQPGEFTRRAFCAGKMDLAQAEAVADLINATSDRAARQAQIQLEGRLSQEVRAIGEELAGLRAGVEAAIDFPEEEIEDADVPQQLALLIERAERLAATYATGRLVREGVRVAIVGRPNAGKSSILNRLAGSERAIVHHAPGTTRDVVEERCAISGLEFRLRDTAGMRETGCEVEALGIARARGEAELADLVLAVFDGSQPPDAGDRLVAEIAASRPCIALLNKCDLPACAGMQTFVETSFPSPLPALSNVEGRGEGQGEGGPLFPLPRGEGARGRVTCVSAITGEGCDELLQHLAAAAMGDGGAAMTSSAIVTSSRHKGALDEAIAALSEAQRIFNSREPIECTAQHLRLAQEALGAITGEVTTEALLDRIFSRFCIGK